MHLKAHNRHSCDLSIPLCPGGDPPGQRLPVHGNAAAIAESVLGVPRVQSAFIVRREGLLESCPDVRRKPRPCDIAAPHAHQEFGQGVALDEPLRAL